MGEHHVHLSVSHRRPLGGDSQSACITFGSFFIPKLKVAVFF